MHKVEKLTETTCMSDLDLHSVPLSQCKTKILVPGSS